MTTTYFCQNCPYKKEDVYDFKKSREERQKREAKDKKLLAEYREDFCWDDKKGQGYITSIDGIQRVVDEWKKKEVKEKDPIYKRAIKLKKLSGVELEKLLTETLEKEKYIKLTFDKPEIGKYVIIPFTIQDAVSTRKEYESTRKLQKIIRKNLENTNWRLMSEGISYRLGYVYGRLKGYEREEDLMEIVRKRNEENPIMETDEGYIY